MNKKTKKLTAVILASCYLVCAAPAPSQNAKAALIDVKEAASLAKDVWKEMDPGIKVLFSLSAPIFIYGTIKGLVLPFCQDVIRPIYRKIKDRFDYNSSKIDSDPVTFNRNASAYLNRFVFAQPKAINKIVNLLSGYIDLWNQGTSKNMANIGACGIVLLGDSGTGKTYTAQLLSIYLFGKSMEPWQFITESSIPDLDFNPEKPNVNFYFTKEKSAFPQDKKLSPADRLFNTQSSLYRQLKNNRKVIIYLDEADKIHKKDPEDTILERLRDAKDTGTLKFYDVNSDDHINVNVQGTCFMISSNEYPQCWGLPERQLNSAQKAARTLVQRDKSLVNRFDVVEYENFKTSDLNMVLRKLISAIQFDFQKNYKIFLKFSDDFFEQLVLMIIWYY